VEGLEGERFAVFESFSQHMLRDMVAPRTIRSGDGRALGLEPGENREALITR